MKQRHRTRRKTKSLSLHRTHIAVGRNAVRQAMRKARGRYTW